MAARSLGVVDNDPMSLVALTTYIKRRMPDMQLVWTAQDADQTIDLLLGSAKIPDVLLVDMSMPDIDGLMLTRKIRERNGKITIVAMTSFPVEEYEEDAAKAGAQAIVSKRSPSEILSTLIEVSARRAADSRMVEGNFVSPRLSHERILTTKPRGIMKLTALENSIVSLCKLGMTSAEIGQRLRMNPVTVNTHLKRACEKMGARNRVQLVAMWIEQSRPKR